MKAVMETDLTTAADAELIERYANGDSVAFDELYGRYRERVYGYLNRLFIGRPDRADDAFQQTWIKVIRNLSRYNNRERFFAWVSRIAHNVAMDYYRSERRRDQNESVDNLPEIADSASNTPLSQLSRRELEMALRQAVAQLPPEQREVFLARQDDVSFKEIAKIQGCSLNTALGRMRYALRNLRELLGRETYDERAEQRMPEQGRRDVIDFHGRAGINEAMG